MADIEKTPSVTAGSPTGETGVGLSESIQQTRKGALLQRLQGRQNDPNELGRELFEKSQHYDEYQLQADAKRVRRKLDLLLLPMAWLATTVLIDRFANDDRCAAPT